LCGTKRSPHSTQPLHFTILLTFLTAPERGRSMKMKADILRSFVNLNILGVICVIQVDSAQICSAGGNIGSFPNITIPNITLPEVEFPEVEFPNLTVPEIEFPDVNLPEIDVPDIPEIPVADDDDLIPSKYIEEYHTGTNSMYPDDFGIKHNEAMSRIEQDAAVTQPQNMPGYLSIISNQLQNFCADDVRCRQVLITIIKLALRYVISERETFSTVTGDLDTAGDDEMKNGSNNNNSRRDRRKLQEVFPEFDLSYTANENIERVLDIIEQDSEEEILEALDDLYLELNLDVKDQDMTDDFDILMNREKGEMDLYEKEVLRGVISIAKSSTEYWHGIFFREEHEGNFYRNLMERRERGSSKTLFDCVQGAGRLYRNNRDSYSSDYRDHQESFYSYDRAGDPYYDDDRHRHRNLRRRTKSIGVLHTKEEQEKIDRIEVLRRTPISVQLQQRELKKEKDQQKEKENDRDDDDGRSDIDSADYDYYTDDARKRGSLSLASVDLSLAVPDVDVDVVAAAGTAAWGLGAVLRWLYFLIRSDIMGLLAGVIVGKNCLLPVSVASSIAFSATYVMCY